MSTTALSPTDIVTTALGHLVQALEILDTRVPAYDFTDQELGTLAEMATRTARLERDLRDLRRVVAAREAAA